MSEAFFILHTIPIVASTVRIEKPAYFQKRERAREKKSKKGGTKNKRPQNSSHRINVGIGT